MKSIGEFLRGRSTFVHCRRLLLSFVCLGCLSVPSVQADDFNVSTRGDYGNITVMELTGNFDADLPDGSVNSTPRKMLANEFYRTHQDNYDFLIFFTNFDYQMPGAEVAGFYLPIKNDIQGIGLEQYDGSSQFGSDGNLQGTIDMRSLEQNGTSPLDPDYTHTLNTLEHEILHRWSAHAQFLDSNGNVSNALIGPGNSHWSYLLDSNASLQYGNDWHDNGNGTFTSVAIRQGYSPLDLYLMGMIDKTQVPPLMLIENSNISATQMPKLGETINGTARTVTIDDIIAAMGERIPDASEAPKSFNAAFVFVTRPDTFNGRELASLEAIRNGFLTRFSILTDGQGLVQVTPTLQPGLSVNPGVDVPVQILRTLPPSLEEGVAWLRQQQQETGRWSDVEETAVRDTAEAMAALGIFGADPGLELGIGWLTGMEPDSTDFFARRLEALALAGAPVGIAATELLERQNGDGGWGSTHAYQSNPTDTSVALRALVRAGQQMNPASLKAATYLADHQNADGGWGGSDAFSMVQPSANALVALNPFENHPQMLASLERGKSFLLGKQNPDGGFGNSPSTIYDSSSALLALGEVGAAAASTRQAVTYLENYQFPDGSWYDSPFQTAAAVQALWRATLDPDLAVSIDSISLIPEQISHLPTEQVVNVVIDNLGRTDVQQATVSLYEGAVDAEHLLLEQSAAFPGLGSTTLTFPLTLDVARTYSLIVVVDPTDQVAELDETNNRSGKTLTVLETRDFAFVTEGLTLSKTELLQGEGVTITAQLTNSGTVGAYKVPVRFSLSDGDSAIVEIATPTVDLPSGQSTRVEFIWYVSHPGDNLQVVAVIDPNNQFDELVETNNQSTTQLNIVSTQLPNFAFESAPEFSSDPALQDGATDISVMLLNSGSLGAQNVTLSFYQGSPEAGGVLLGTSVIPEIKAGERLPASFAWNDIPDIGEQLIVVRADVDGALTEVDESDNQTLSRLMVLSRADLVVAQADVAISPSAPREGEAVVVTVNLYNNGQQDATDITVVLDLDGTLIEKTVPLVAAKGWSQFETILGESLAPGVHNLSVIVDPVDSIRELSEENNHAELSFGVQNADLWVSEKYFSPNGDGVKDATELYYRFATEQTVSVEVRNDIDEVVRLFSGSKAVAILNGQVRWDGRNDRGAVVADGPYQVNLLSTAGAILGSTQVVVDTNRSSLFAALGTEFLLDESLACDLPRGVQWEWLPNERRLLFAITQSTLSDYETGIFAKDVASGEVRRLVPDEWISSNPLMSYTGFKFFLSPDKTQLALTFNKRDVKNMVDSSELWLVDSRGGGMRQLRNYDRYNAVYDASWSPNSQSLLIESSQLVELLDVINFNSKILDVPSGTFSWSPNGARLLQSGSVLRVIELDGSVNEVFNEWSDGYWLNDRQIVSVVMDSYERYRFIWLIDAQGIEAPLLLSDDYSHSLVLAPDGRHFAFVEGASNSGGVKKVTVVDTTGNKTTIREIPYQDKDDQYSYYDTHYGSGIVSNLLWSADGKRLAYVDRQAEPIGESTFVPKLVVYGVDDNEQNSTPIFACTSFYSDSSDFFWSGCDDVEPQLEMGRVKSLLYWSEDGRLMVVEGEDSPYLIDLVTGEKRVLPVDDTLHYSFFLDEILYSGSTCDAGGIALWRFASLLNLTADLRSVRENSAISLYGTAADLNFSNYRLEYANVGQPDTWLPIQPSVSKPVVDDYLTLWVPPQPGSYFVQLTVVDKAGNQSVSRKRVNWNTSSALNNIYRSEDIFSPNGDGVKDSASLLYTVVSPVQFTVDVANAKGEIVRSFARSYSQPMEDGIVWDGRDEDGQVVPDGHYTLKLADYSFPVEVDATAPVAFFNLGSYAGYLQGLGELKNNATALTDIRIVEGFDDVFSATFTSPEPSSALVKVSDSDGIVVRSIENNLPSTQSVVVWDGRDDSGQPVADGRYTLLVVGSNGQTFAFEIDIVASETGIDLSFDNSNVTLLGEADDVNLTELWVERKRTNGFNGWAIYQEAGCQDIGQAAQGNANSRKQCSKQFQGEEVGDTFRFQDYRLVAKDRAGNVSTVVAPRLKPDFELYVWGVPKILGAELGLVRYLEGEIPFIKQGELLIHQATGFTTLNEPWVDIRMQYWIDGEWHDAVEVQQVYRPAPLQHFNDPQDGSFSFIWDATPVLDGLPFKIRLKAVNAAGEVRLSNEYSTDNLFVIIPQCDGYAGKVNLFENLRELRHQVVPANVLEEIISQRFPGELLVDLLKTESASHQGFLDAIENVWVDYQRALFPEEIPGNEYDRGLGTERYETDYPLPLPSDIGVGDLLRLQGKGESETTYSSFPKVYQPECDVKVAVKEIPKERADCSSVVDTSIVVAVSVTRESVLFVSQMLEFGTLEDGKETILKSWNALELSEQVDIPREIQINLTQYPPGDLDLFARLTYLDLFDGQTKTIEAAKSLMIPDFSVPAPIVELISPAPGTSLSCPLWQNPDGIWKPMVLEGSLEASQQLKTYELCYMSEKTKSWMVASIANKSPLWGQKSYLGELGSIDTGKLKENEASKLRLLVRDQNGLSGYDEISLVSGEIALVSQLSSSAKIYSPNADGRKDVVTFYYHQAEDAPVSIQVSGMSINAELLSSQFQLAGDHSFVWNGNVPGIGVVLDGNYEITVSAVDPCGNESREAVVVGIDTVPPVLEIVYPAPMSSFMVGKVVEVSATTDERPLSRYTLVANSVNQLSGLATEVIAEGTDWPGNDRPGNWQTSVSPGIWTLLLSAVDEAGNIGEASVQVELLSRPILFTGMLVDPAYISPNGDGRQDQINVNYELLESSQISYEILDANSIPVHTYVVPGLSPGAQGWFWNGLNSSGMPASDGQYTCRLTAALTADPNLTQVEELSFVVDTTPPILVVNAPEPDAYLTTSSIALSGVIDDVNLHSYVVEVTSDSGPILSDTGEAAQSVYELPLIQKFVEGAYHIQAFAYDLAGNRTDLAQTFTIDLTPPQVELLRPDVDSGFGGDASVMAISGKIVEEHLDNYVLRYGFGETPSSWTTLTTDTQSATGEVSSDWSIGLTSGLADGVYTLSLVATDLADQTEEANRQVLIDNTSPVAEIAEPFEGALIAAPFAITGTATDGNFGLALLELSSGHCQDAYRWAQLDALASATAAGPLGDLQVLPVDGDYCLRLTVTDLVGNQSVATRQIFIDTTPPELPVLSGQILEHRDVQLDWTTAGEPDLSGYRIYRDGVQLAQQSHPETNFNDPDLPEGEYRYQIVAFDMAGNSSTQSNSFLAEVDRTPPLVILSHPVASARVGDLVDVHGTAFSQDDFAEYRLSYGLGEQPIEMTLLRQSPVPVSGNRLIQWDSWGLPDGLYTLRLEAEDLSGNKAIDSVQVQIDNTPPQAPVLNTPDVLLSDIDLSWEPNTESDIAGYLLFDNGRLVNSTGVVIGPLTPYLLSDLDYLDANVPDGRHGYTLYAVDGAGNQSLPSQEREVEVDTRAPQAVIVAPTEGTTFEEPISVIAASEDLDVVALQFQYRPAGSNLWLDLGAAVNAAPYEVVLDPVLAALSFGEVELRAMATDRGGQVDSAPAVIRIEYRDMTAPSVPVGLVASLACDEITLSWNANGEDDLAGYNVYRYFGDNYESRQNGQLVIGTTWAQTYSYDGSYSFVVKAVDQNGNESLHSETTTALRQTPNWVRNEELTIELQMDLAGANAYSNAKVNLISDNITIAETLTDATGEFVFAGTPLVRGDNEFSVVAEDEKGNRSCTSDPLLIKKTVLLPPPVNLQDVVTGHDIQLDWQPVVDPEFDHYFVYRDGERLSPPVQQIPTNRMAVSASSTLATVFDPVGAIDGDWTTSWVSSGGSGAKWLEIAFDMPRQVKQIELDWYDYWRGRDYEIQAWDGSNWLTLSQVNGNTNSSFYMEYNPEYLTSKIRLYVSSVDNTYGYARVRELALYEKPVIDIPDYGDMVDQDGLYNYQVSTVNSYGMEGPLSPILAVAVGDVAPPAPPINLQIVAPPEGRSLLLSWEAGSAELSDYTIYRSLTSGGPYEEVGTSVGSQFAYVDRGLTNGTRYYYVVTASDQFDNESAHSNEGSGVSVNSLLPEAPAILFPTVPGTDKTLYEMVTDIRGLSEPDATVTLYKDNILMSEVSTLGSSESNSVNYDFDGFDAVLSPNGEYLLYLDWDRYDDGLVLRRLSTGDETLLDERAEYYAWSGDSRQIVYIYDDQNWDNYLVKYEVGTATRTVLTSDPDNDLDYPATSHDGSIIAYVSDRNGDDDVWVHDLTEGTITQISTGMEAEEPAVSPDGSKIAYYDDYAITLNAYEGDTGQTVEIDYDPYWRHFEWSPDSRTLAYFSYINGNKDLYVYDSIDQVSRQITDVDSSKYFLHWSPEGKSLVYGHSEDDSIRVQYLSGVQSNVFAGYYSLTTLQWLDNGKIAFIDDDSNQINYILPPGTFTFESVPLQPGENQFYATATDQLGRLTPNSEPVTLIYDSSHLPDIVVDAGNIFISPIVPSPGEIVVANVLVRNPTETALSRVKIDLYLWDAQTELVFLESRLIEQLDGGESSRINLSFVAPESAGTSSLLVVADPEDAINELVESNNFAAREFHVTAADGVQMSLSLDGDVYSSHQDVAITLDLLNNGPDIDSRLVVQVFDQAGYPVETLDDLELPLQYGQEKLTYVWNAGAFFAGGYQIRSAMFDAAGELVAEQYHPFTIRPDRSVALRLTADRTSYGAKEPVQLETELRNTGENDVPSNLQLVTVITDSSGQVVMTNNQSVAQLLPQMSARFPSAWNTGLTAPGDFKVVSEVRLDGISLQTGMTSFTIVPVSRIVGRLAVEPQVVVYGFDFTLPYSVDNQGNQPATGQLKVALMDPETLEVVADAVQESSVAVTGNSSGLFSFASAGLQLKSYRARLYFVSSGAEQFVGETQFSVVDGLAPDLAVIAPVANETYRMTVDFAACALDDISGVESVSYRLDGRSWQLLPFADLAAGQYAMSWQPNLNDNGQHTIEFRALDHAGNQRLSSLIPFELQMDVTPPVTTFLVGEPQYQDETGFPYLVGTTPVRLIATDDISGVESTLYRVDTGDWTLYAEGIALAGLADGDHAVSYYSIDLIGNQELEKTFHFVIDNSAPVISIAVPLDGGYYNADVLPQFETNDILPIQTETLLQRNGEVINGVSLIVAEGEYRLAVNAVDSLGNQSSTTVDFTIDRTPPGVSVAGFNDGGFYNADVIPVLQISDLYLAGSTLLLNGEGYVSGSVVVGEGRYELTATAIDLAGNSTEASWSFVIDKTQPVSALTYSLPYFGTTNALFVSPQTQFALSADDPGLTPSGVASIEYAFDSDVGLSDYEDIFTLEGLSEGPHDVYSHANDIAGNLETQHLLQVVLDRTPPTTVVTQSGDAFLDDTGTLFVNGGTGFNIDATDNLSGVARTLYRIDDGVWNDFSPFALTGLTDGQHVIGYHSSDHVANTESEQTLVVTADNTPPVTSISASGLQYSQGDILHVAAATAFSLETSDNYAGVARTEYRIDSGNWTAYAPFTLMGLPDGEHAIGYRSMDTVGNAEVEQVLTVVIDNTAPVTNISVGGPLHSRDGILYVPAASGFSLTADDSYSGVSRIEYRVDGGAWTDYQLFFLNGLSDGEHVIGYRSADHLANVEPEKTLLVIVDNSPPVTELAIGLPQYAGDNLHVTGDTGFTLTSSDNLAGLASIEYRIDAGAWSAYAPFALAGLADGQHTVGYRSIDTVGNVENEQILNVTLDDSAPATTIEVDNPQYTATGAFYVTGATVISLSSIDNLSGVAATEYRIAGGGWLSYSPFTLSGLPDGEHTIGYRSTDNMSNLESEQTLTVWVDNSVPETTRAIDQQYSDASDLFVTGASLFTLSATDNLSGVADTECRIDAQSWASYTPFSMVGLSDGEHIIRYRSKDNVTNLEPEQVLAVIIDNTPPQTNLFVGPQKYSATDILYVTGITDFTLSATDNLSGVAATEFSIDGGAWVAYVPFNLGGLSDGEHTIGYRSTDNLSNVEIEQMLVVTVDNTAPVTTIDVAAPRFTGGDRTCYITGSSEFNISANDDYSGVVSTEYRIDGGVWTAYTPFTLAGMADGAHMIGYRSHDNLNNLEIEQVLTVIVDNTAPDVSVTVGDPRYIAADGTLYISEGTVLSLAADDDNSGVATIEYRVDSGAWLTDSPFTLTGLPEGKVVIGFRALDNLGNQELEKSLVVVVDNSPPVTSIAFKLQSYLNSDRLLISRQTELTFTAVDSGAGVADIFYRFDDQMDWQQYQGAFRLDALDFGSHVIQFRSTDHVRNWEVEKTVEIVLVGVEVDSAVVNVPRVLIWLGEKEDGNGHDREDDDYKDQHDKDAHQDDNQENDDDYREDVSRQDAVDLVTQAFSGQDAYFRIVSEKDEYFRAFRSGVFNLTLIMADDLPFEGDLLPEFVEGVHRGMGLLFAPGNHDGDSRLEALLGVKFKGRLSQNKNQNRLQLYQSPFAEEREVGLSGTVLKTELAGGELAALIPGDNPSEPVNCMTLYMPLVLHTEDVVKITLLRRHDGTREIVDEEWLSIEDKNAQRVSQYHDNDQGDLSLISHDDDGIVIRVASKYGVLEDYELDAVLISHKNGHNTNLMTGLELNCQTNWSVGAPIGNCRVIGINDKEEPHSSELPGIILNQFGNGRTAFFAFDLTSSAKSDDRTTYLALLRNALSHLLPAEKEPQAIATELLETKIQLLGHDMDFAAIEDLWPGLSYKPLFNHSQSVLEYLLAADGNGEWSYRYFVQSEDRSGVYGKQTEIQLFVDGLAATYEFFPYSFVVEKDSKRLLDDTIAWVDTMIQIYPSGVCVKNHHYDHDDHDANGDNGDNGDDCDPYSELRKQLLKIDLMDKTSGENIDKIINKVVDVLSKFDKLPVANSEPRYWMSDYLRIMEVKSTVFDDEECEDDD